MEEYTPVGAYFVYITFILMTFCTLGGALGVVLSRRLFHSGLCLVLSLFGVAGYYVLLNAGFLAVVQVAVYVGAIAILMLFAIMFARDPMKPADPLTQQAIIGLPIAGLLGFLLVWIVASTPWPITDTMPTDTPVQDLGLALLTSYLIPFEVVGVLLSAALVGAIILAREKTKAEQELLDQ